MIGMVLSHAGGVVGPVDAVTVDPAGNALCRIKDRWLFVVECFA